VHDIPGYRELSTCILAKREMFTHFNCFTLAEDASNGSNQASIGRQKVCGLSDPVARRDKNVKLQQMYIAVRMNLTDEQESRACLMNTGENSLRSELA
jgi:hypothetical protein